ncbi:MAG: hypothetical protein AB7F32_07375 [Victivallaceae bacterium]
MIIERDNRYFWGRKFILLARVLAALIFLAGLLLTGLTLSWTLTRLKALPPGVTPELKADILLAQRTLQDNYEKTVNSLAMIQQRMISAQQDFVIPSSLTLLDTVFDDQFDNPEQLRHSRQVLEAYAQRIDGLKKLIAELIRRQTAAIAPKIAVAANHAMPQNPGISVRNRQMIRFYRTDKQSALQDLREAIGALKTGGKFDQIREPVAYLEIFSDAIAGNVTGPARPLNVAPAEPENSAAAARERENRALDALRTIDSRLEELNAEWSVDDDLKTLKMRLDEADRQQEARRMARDSILVQGLLGALVFFGALALGSLLVLVAADFLRAHFDSADELAKGNRG